MSSPKFIPVCEPSLIGNEKKYVLDCLETNWISSAGSYVDRFENEFAQYCGVAHGVSCSNGTTALHLAMLSLGIKKDDEVIVPNYTMVASLLAILYVGAIPVFIDVEADTGNIDSELIEQSITPKTKAIMVVHLFGHPCDMDPIIKIAKKHKLFTIEDAAEAHGATYKGKKVGNLSDIACFSFYGNKLITTGEGGMVITNLDKLAKQSRYYKNLCFPVDGPRNYQHQDIGYNYRLTNIQAALGVAQLENIDRFISARRDNAKRYNQGLSDIEGLQLPIEKDYAQNVYWMYTVYVDEKKFGMNRDQLMEKLQEKGIGTRKVFYPLHRQPLLKKITTSTNQKFPVTDKLSETGLYLPSGSGLQKSDQDRIIDALHKIASK